MTRWSKPARGRVTLTLVEWIHWISFDGDQEAEDYLWEREKAQRGVEGLD